MKIIPKEIEELLEDLEKESTPINRRAARTIRALYEDDEYDIDVPESAMDSATA